MKQKTLFMVLGLIGYIGSIAAAQVPEFTEYKAGLLKNLLTESIKDPRVIHSLAYDCYDYETNIDKTGFKITCIPGSTFQALFTSMNERWSVTIPITSFKGDNRPHIASASIDIVGDGWRWPVEMLANCHQPSYQEEIAWAAQREPTTPLPTCLHSRKGLPMLTPKHNDSANKDLCGAQTENGVYTNCEGVTANDVVSFYDFVKVLKTVADQNELSQKKINPKQSAQLGKTAQDAAQALTGQKAPAPTTSILPWPPSRDSVWGHSPR